MSNNHHHNHYVSRGYHNHCWRHCLYHNCHVFHFQDPVIYIQCICYYIYRFTITYIPAGNTITLRFSHQTDIQVNDIWRVTPHPSITIIRERTTKPSPLTSSSPSLHIWQNNSKEEGIRQNLILYRLSREAHSSWSVHSSHCSIVKVSAWRGLEAPSTPQ